MNYVPDDQMSNVLQQGMIFSSTYIMIPGTVFSPESQNSLIVYT